MTPRRVSYFVTSPKRRACAWGGGILLVFLFVWQQLQSVRLGYAVEETRRSIAAFRERNGYLRLELERRTSPEAIAMAARERLKMIPPSPDSLIILEAEPGRPPERARRGWTLLSRLFR